MIHIERVVELVIKEKMHDMGDTKETVADSAYRNAMKSIFTSIDWDFEEESIKDLEEGF